MRVRLLRRCTAAALVVAIGVTGPARPAVAAPLPTTFDWVGAIVSVVGTVLGGGGGSGGLEAAVRQIINAVEASEQAILNHIDSLASAEVRACARQHTIEFSDIENMGTTTRQIWAQNATSCATLATAYLESVQAKPDVDKIGIAVSEIYAIAVAARARAGLVNGIDLLIRDQIRSYETLIVKLKPDCSEQSWTEYDDRGRPVLTETHYTCVAYNGDLATDYEAYLLRRLIHGPLDRAKVDADATRNTSRKVAMDGLPRLRTLPH